MRSITYNEDSGIINVVFDGALTTVIIEDCNGITAKGHALQNAEDQYDSDFGQALALSRASNRYFHKLEKHLVRSTK